MIEGKI